MTYFKMLYSFFMDRHRHFSYNFGSPIYACVWAVLLLGGLSNRAIGQPVEYFASRTNDSAGVRMSTKSITVEKINLDKQYFHSYFHDTKHILTAPVRWRTAEWTKAALLTGTALALYQFDAQIRTTILNHRSEISNSVSGFCEIFGNKKYALLPPLLFYLAGKYYKNTTANNIALLSAKSLFFAAGIAAALKVFSQRRSPGPSETPYAWAGPKYPFSGQSFPSGHATLAFALATVIAAEYSETSIIPITVYGLAAGTALSRLNDDKHWASDVFAGAVIGHFTAKAILQSNNESKFHSYPLLDLKHKRIGLGFVF